MKHKDSKLPLGIKILIGYLGLIGLFSFAFLSLPSFWIGLAMTLISIAIIIFLIIGLSERIDLARKGTIIFFIVAVILSLIAIFIGRSDFDEKFFIKNLISGFIIVYLNLPEIKQVFTE